MFNGKKTPLQVTKTISEANPTQYSEIVLVDAFKRAKEEMQRLGFETFDEYQEYLDFIEMKKAKKKDFEMK